MLESLVLIVLPSPLLPPIIQHNRVEKLLSLDLCKLGVDLHAPVVEELRFGESLYEAVDLVESVVRLVEQVAAEVTHFVAVLRKVLGEAGFVAARWNQIDRLIF